MNSIPILTLDSLSKNDFEVKSNKLNFKISKAVGNGLSLSRDGLMYSANSSGRTFIGRILPGKGMEYHHNQDFSLWLEQLDYGDDPLRVCIFMGETTDHLIITRFNSFDSNLDSEPAHMWRGYEYYNRYSDHVNQVYSISYQVYENGKLANKGVTISHVKINDQFFVWMDELIPTSALGDGGNGDGGPTGSGDYLIGNKYYDYIWLHGTFGLEYALVYAEEVDGDGNYTENFHLFRIEQDGSLNNSNPLETLPVNIAIDCHYSSQHLVLLKPDEKELIVYKGNTRHSITLSGQHESATVAAWAGEGPGELMIGVTNAATGVTEIYKATSSGVSLHLLLTQPNLNLDSYTHFCIHSRLMYQESFFTINEGYNKIDDDEWVGVYRASLVSYSNGNVLDSIETVGGYIHTFSEIPYFLVRDVVDNSLEIKIYKINYDSGFELVDQYTVFNGMIDRIHEIWLCGSTLPDSDANAGLLFQYDNYPDAITYALSVVPIIVDGEILFDVSTYMVGDNLFIGNSTARGFSEMIIGSDDVAMMDDNFKFSLLHTQKMLPVVS